MGAVTGWRHRLPRVSFQTWHDSRHGPARRPARMRRIEARMTQSGQPVDVVVPTAWGRIVEWWRGL